MSTKKSNQNFVKYSGLAFQLLAYIGVGYFIGNFVDNRWNASETPYARAGFSILFLLIGLYSVVRDLIREN